MTFGEAPLALVAAMASDKDHVGFAREFLSGIVPCWILLSVTKNGFITNVGGYNGNMNCFYVIRTPSPPSHKKKPSYVKDVVAPSIILWVPSEAPKASFTGGQELRFVKNFSSKTY